MQQNYQDSMAIVARFGKPDLFITVTSNPQWKEITENLPPGQTPADRPELIARVFKLNLDAIFGDLLKSKVFGQVAAYVRVTEFQKRGLPHAHLLLILGESDKPRTPEEVNRVCSAEIPNFETEQLLQNAVKTFMIHKNCVATFPRAPCAKEEKCSKKFPKELRDETSVSNDGHPHLRRRNLFAAEISGSLYRDEYVVPYNPYLLLKFNCHINVEICGMISSVKSII